MSQAYVVSLQRQSPIHSAITRKIRVRGDATKRLAIDRLNATRARALPSKCEIATPNAAHITTEAKHVPARTLAIIEVCNSTSASVAVKAASAPTKVTHPFGLTQVNSTPSTKLMGLAHVALPLAASACEMR